jgi:hypothetical protein
MIAALLSLPIKTFRLCHVVLHGVMAYASIELYPNAVS